MLVSVSEFNYLAQRGKIKFQILLTLVFVSHLIHVKCISILKWFILYLNNIVLVPSYEPQNMMWNVFDFRFVERLIETSPMQEQGAQVYFDYFQYTARPCTRLQIDSDAFWRCVSRHTTHPENHQVSTCRMGSATDGII